MDIGSSTVIAAANGFPAAFKKDFDDDGIPNASHILAEKYPKEAAYQKEMAAIKDPKNKEDIPKLWKGILAKYGGEQGVLNHEEFRDGFAKRPEVKEYFQQIKQATEAGNQWLKAAGVENIDGSGKLAGQKIRESKEEAIDQYDKRIRSFEKYLNEQKEKQQGEDLDRWLRISG